MSRSATLTLGYVERRGKHCARRAEFGGRVVIFPNSHSHSLVDADAHVDVDVDPCSSLARYIESHRSVRIQWRGWGMDMRGDELHLERIVCCDDNGDSGGQRLSR